MPGTEIKKLPEGLSNFDLECLKQGSLAKQALPKAIQLNVYHLAGAPDNAAVKIHLYKDRLMDQYTAAALFYLESISQKGHLPKETEAMRKVKDDFGNNMFPKTIIQRHVTHFRRIITKLDGEVTAVTKDELISMLYELLNSKKKWVVNDGYTIDPETKSKIFHKKEIDVELTPDEKLKIIDKIAEIRGFTGGSGAFKFPGDMTEGKMTFEFRKTAPPGTNPEEYQKIRGQIEVENG